MSQQRGRQWASVMMALAVAVGIGWSTAAAAQQNPFGGRAAPREQPAGDEAAGEQAAPDPARTAAEPPLIALPKPVQAVFRQVGDWQRELNRFMGGKMRESTAAGGLTAAFVLLGASFLYGVLHAAGPGHGKLVVASYFTARRAPLATGILMGGIIAVTQAVVAILAVTVLAVIIGRRQMDVMSDVNVLEIGSYGIIFCIGAYMTWCALRGREAFGHDHGPAASTFDDPAPKSAAPDHQHHNHHHHAHHDHDHHDHDHDHHHGHHDHAHHHDDGTRARSTWLARTARAMFGRYGEILAVGVVSGVRPCSGSILVLLFSLANGVFLLGVAAALMIALGVAITISALGIGTIVLRRAVAGGDAPASPWQAFAGRALAVAGSLAVMVMGGLLFGGALQTYGVI
ncbi:MAG: hypothetical protein SFV21_12755 [Rhodospirillaceae bacterium]|nr:hypothetical protein [Rhodospirillaceae bacterium]